MTLGETARAAIFLSSTRPSLPACEKVLFLSAATGASGLATLCCRCPYDYFNQVDLSENNTELDG